MGRGDVVELAGQRVRLEELRAHPHRYTRLFTEAKAVDGHGHCLCRTDEPRRLVIRCLNTRHFLARWPGDGAEHQDACPFHQPDPTLSGRSAYADNAIVEGVEGTTIRFDTPLLSTTATASDGAAEDLRASAAGSGRRAVGLLGLLHFLWEDTQLNSWRPGIRRNWASVVHDIAHCAQDCTISRRALVEVLYPVPPYRPDIGPANIAAFDAWLDRLRSPRDQIRRGLLLGELVEVEATKYGMSYKIRHLAKRVFLSGQLHQRILRSYSHAFTRAATEHDGRRVGLFLIERSPKGHAVLAGAAIMLTTAGTYIPADSSHELVMAAALQQAGRAFLKPVRYHHTVLTLPDFVLTDTAQPTVIEVWGLDSEEYLRRKEIKIGEYQRIGTDLIGWRPPQQMPDLALPR
ncbi:DUF1173 family protein [Nocardia sp. NPDC006630]|uniref:DUF1173 family protein n=1 Tax=Nocardia sp. NPDC006630 TaxID=3157181 RepID=UPI00339DD63F